MRPVAANATTACSVGKPMCSSSCSGREETVDLGSHQGLSGHCAGPSQVRPGSLPVASTHLGLPAVESLGRSWGKPKPVFPLRSPPRCATQAPGLAGAGLSLRCGAGGHVRKSRGKRPHSNWMGTRLAAQPGHLGEEGFGVASALPGPCTRGPPAVRMASAQRAPDPGRPELQKPGAKYVAGRVAGS